MPMPAPDRQRMFIIGVAATSATLAALSFRVISGATVVATKPVPATNARSIIRYLAPLQDSTGAVDTPAGSFGTGPDPFAGAGFQSTRIAAGRSKPPKHVTSDRPWIVSSILLQDTLR